jgi:hypothetical protein
MTFDAAKLIGERLDTGRLPLVEPAKMWIGFGRDEPCDGCDEPIHPTQVQYVVDAEGKAIRFHETCAALWDAERQRRGGLKSGSDTTEAPGG